MRFTAILLWLLAFAAQPAFAANSFVSSMQNELAMLVTSKSADVGIAAIDLATGETVSVRGNMQYPMASTVKVAVAATYLSYVEEGDRSLKKEMIDHERKFVSRYTDQELRTLIALLRRLHDPD